MKKSFHLLVMINYIGEGYKRALFISRLYLYVVNRRGVILLILWKCYLVLNIDISLPMHRVVSWYRNEGDSVNPYETFRNFTPISCNQVDSIHFLLTR